jgi:alanine racemase
MGNAWKLEHRDAWIDVDLSAIRANLRALASLLPSDTQVAPVVKANAYGHGAIAVARDLADEGCSAFCVATVDEGLQLRRAGIAARIIILYEAPVAAWEAAVASRLELTLSSVEGLAAVRSAPESALLHLKLDTGMTRQGLREGDLDVAIRLGGDLRARLAGIWTHLADGADLERAGVQLVRFDAAFDRLADADLRAPRHVAASAAILRGVGTGYEMARPGLAVFGVLPEEFAGRGLASPVALVPAMRVLARPVRIVTVPPGTRVGYGGTFTTARSTRIATLPLGYGDGVFRSLGNGTWSVLVRGHRAPIIGRISMDGITVDVSDVPGAGRSDTFTLLGRDGGDELACATMARAAGTIPQEVLVRLDARLPQRVTGASAGASE